MLDIATRPLPPAAVASLGVSFDWRLGQPGAAVAHPWTDFSDPTGVPAVYAEVLEVHALELEDTLRTAIIHSLFTDRRASIDDKLPAGVTDRRGWVGDEFLTPGEESGSLLWLVYVSKVTSEVLERARFSAQESLAWLVRTGVASRVAVEAEWVNDRLAVRPQIFQGSNVSPVYDVLWGTTIKRGDA